MFIGSGALFMQIQKKIHRQILPEHAYLHRLQIHIFCLFVRAHFDVFLKRDHVSLGRGGST